MFLCCCEFSFTFLFLNLSFCAAWISTAKLKDVINKDVNKVLNSDSDLFRSLHTGKIPQIVSVWF